FPARCRGDISRRYANCLENLWLDLARTGARSHHCPALHGLPRGISRMKRFVKSSGLVALCALAPIAAALAQDAGPPSPEQVAEQAVLTRQGLLKVMSFYMAPVGGMLKNKIPFDAAVATKSATNIAALGTMIPDVFTADTRGKTSVKTKAQDGV